MPNIYCIQIQENDGWNQWDKQVLHTTNKKQLEDLAARLNKKHKNNDNILFRVETLAVTSNSLTRDDIKNALQEYQ